MRETVTQLYKVIVKLREILQKYQQKVVPAVAVIQLVRILPF